jgi:hypothetical protein
MKKSLNKTDKTEFLDQKNVFGAHNVIVMESNIARHEQNLLHLDVGMEL